MTVSSGDLKLATAWKAWNESDFQSNVAITLFSSMTRQITTLLSSNQGLV